MTNLLDPRTFSRLQLDELSIDPMDASTDACECCSGTTHRIWGFVEDAETTVAAYFVTWTQGGRAHPAWFDLIVGDWEDGSTPSDRAAVSLDYCESSGGTGFIIVDATQRLENTRKLAEHILTREDVVGTQLAEHVFTILDAIGAGDERLSELRDWQRPINSPLPPRVA